MRRGRQRREPQRPAAQLLEIEAEGDIVHQVVARPRRVGADVLEAAPLARDQVDIGAERAEQILVALDRVRQQDQPARPAVMRGDEAPRFAIERHQIAAAAVEDDRALGPPSPVAVIEQPAAQPGLAQNLERRGGDQRVAAHCRC